MNDKVYYENFRPQPDFLPFTLKELKEQGVETPDFVLVTGDAYVDHPSFGAALIGKLLWAQGYSVGVISQPDWNEAASFQEFGKPRLGFLITSGNVDSMVNHYTVAKKRRDKDFYSPGGKAGLRPDRALMVYSRKVREIFGPDIPIILGGLEASLRRLAHYDYWSDSVRKSVLLDSKAHILVYGMGENTISEIASYLAAGVPVKEIRYVRGSVVAEDRVEDRDCLLLPSYEEITRDKRTYAKSYAIQYKNADSVTGKALAEKCGKSYVVQNPPAPLLEREEMDRIYGLHFAREPHPSYHGDVPSIEEVKFSVSFTRGCFGACNFCALAFHQGRHVVSRSLESALTEGKLLTGLPGFKGYIHDVGGPTANFTAPSCETQKERGVCPDRKCLGQKPCKSLRVSHRELLALLRKMRAIPGVKKVFVRSGIRFDYMMMDKDETFFRELCQHHVSGQLKVAPEHVSPSVLKHMGKPGKEVYDSFVSRFHHMNQKLGMEQYLVPYLMSSHPGSGLGEAVELAEYLRDHNISPQQVQDFYPTPGTVSTCMYYTGFDPFTMQEVYTPKSPHEKAMQRALIQYRLPANRELVREALIKAGRGDLIGFGKNCLIRPRETAYSRKQGDKARDGKPRDIKPAGKAKKKTIRNVHKKKS